MSGRTDNEKVWLIVEQDVLDHGTALAPFIRQVCDRRRRLIMPANFLGGITNPLAECIIFRLCWWLLWRNTSIVFPWKDGWRGHEAEVPLYIKRSPYAVWHIYFLFANIGSSVSCVVRYLCMFDKCSIHDCFGPWVISCSLMCLLIINCLCRMCEFFLPLQLLCKQKTASGIHLNRGRFIQ